MMNANYDVVVVGGGVAGLSAALMLARSRRSMLVVDAGEPRNAPAVAVHGVLGHDGIGPVDLVERGRGEVRGYGGHIEAGTVDRVTRDGEEFAVTLADGRSVRGRRLLVATGLVDELPDIPGLRARWGRDVVHCPYCHGWEVRDRAIGVLGAGPRSLHQALLFRQLTPDVRYFAHTASLTEDEAAQLSARGIGVISGEVESLEILDDKITAVRLLDGSRVEREVLAVSPRASARASFLAGIGLHPVPHPSGAGDHLPSDPTGRTDVPGVWVAGNVTDLSAHVGTAAAAGALAGAQINADLVEDEVRATLAAVR